jgi:hypothetical protein
MPIVLIRDPYSWMHSMCHHAYAAQWKHSAQHCPNLVVVAGRNESNVPVSIPYPDRHEQWDSLAHLWSDWYRQYLQADYPRLIVRYVIMCVVEVTVIDEK